MKSGKCALTVSLSPAVVHGKAVIKINFRSILRRSSSRAIDAPSRATCCQLRSAHRSLAISSTTLLFMRGSECVGEVLAGDGDNGLNRNLHISLKARNHRGNGGLGGVLPPSSNKKQGDRPVTEMDLKDE